MKRITLDFKIAAADILKDAAALDGVTVSAWLRSAAAEKLRRNAERYGIAPEDIERIPSKAARQMPPDED